MGTYTAEGCLEPIETFYNPGMVDETKRSAARKIPGRIRTQNGCLHYEGGEKDALDRIAEWGSTVRKRLSEALPPREAALLGGMLLGGSEGMDASSLQIFTACGLSHLLSVSGSHVALLLGLYVLAAEYLPLPRPVKPLGASFFCSATPSFAGFGHLSAEQCSLAAASCWGSCWGAGQADRLFLAFRPFCCWASIPLDLGYWLCPLFCGSGRTDALKGEGGTGACIFLGQGLGTALSVPPRGPYFFPSFACPSFPRREPPIPSSQSASCAAFEPFPRSCRQCRFWGSCPALLGRVLLLWQAVSSVYLLNWAVCFQKAGPSWLLTGPLGFGALFAMVFCSACSLAIFHRDPVLLGTGKRRLLRPLSALLPCFSILAFKSTFYSVFP